MQRPPTDWTTEEVEEVLAASFAARRSPRAFSEARNGGLRSPLTQSVVQIAPGHGSGLVVLSSVVPALVGWLWRHRLPLGKVTVFDGDPGLGKSTIMLDLAARVSTGSPMPGEEIERQPAGVVLLSAEDGLADTIRPRLDAAGADPTRVAAMVAIPGADRERLPSLPLDLDRVEEAARTMDAALIVIDPLMAYLDESVNSHRDQDVRRALAPLAAVAERTAAAVVVVRHLNKSGGPSALYRGGGSIGIIGAARSGLLAAVDPEDEGRCILAVAKSNLGPKPPALAYRLVADPSSDVAHIAWEGQTHHTAGELLASHASVNGSALDEAKEVLADILRQGSVPAREVKATARAAGIAERTLERAKTALGVSAHKIGRPGEAGRWEWSLPTEDRQQETKDANAQDWRSSAANGGLRPVRRVEDDYPRSAWDPDA